MKQVREKIREGGRFVLASPYVLNLTLSSSVRPDRNKSSIGPKIEI